MRGTLPRRVCLLVGGVIAVSLLSAAGCESSGRNEPTTAVRDAALKDIPKPAGYQLVNERSVLRQSGQIRAGQVEYEGKTPRDALKRFYEEYMPSAGFTLRELSLDRGVYNMRFESDREVCNVRITEQRAGASTVTVEIGPKPEGSTEKPAVPQRRPRPAP